MIRTLLIIAGIFLLLGCSAISLALIIVNGNPQAVQSILGNIGGMFVAFAIFVVIIAVWEGLKKD